MEWENLAWEQEGRVAIITLNRPKALNALNEVTIAELNQALDRVERDKSIGAVIITGSGEKAFAAGADIGELRDLEDMMAGVEKCRRGHNLFSRMEQLGKPVIAAINGFAFGGGLELALACDIRLAADSARLGLPEITLGIMPGYGGTQRLARLIGSGMAKYLIFTGTAVKAAEAQTLGIVEKVYPGNELMTEAKKLATELASRAPIALALAKRAVTGGLETDLATGCAMEAHYFGIIAGTEDAKEGTGAFLDKRPPQFRGR